MKKIAFIVAAISLIVISCNTSPFTGGNPKDVLIKFFDALSRRDVATARTYATKESETMLNLMEMGLKMAPDSVKNKVIDKDRLQIGDAVVSGDNATVPVKDKPSGEMTTFSLTKESGAWKVVFDMTSMMNMGQNKMKEKGFDQKKIDKIMNDMKGVIDSNPELRKLSDSLQ